ncbi:ferritin [Pontibacter sp. G13]|uniref:ferritin n=1 Tax=Pontibacter sp. G13 TaxID=3074898 RepID=UPI00288C4EEF|nr:ferritin [Pontibacter sp. G13]WNJ18977.1 ferritin [Pontibacter sp. G13]
MLSEKMQQLINDQYHRELFSANQYLAMSSYFLQEDLDGFANFFRVQAEEELMHAMKQFDYLHEVDGKIEHGPIDSPSNTFGSLLEVFEEAYKHEQLITKHIHEIVKVAMQEGDFATHQFFQWFVMEQVEEESTMRTLIAKIKLIDGNKSALYLMNEELMKRKAEAEENAA